MHCLKVVMAGASVRGVPSDALLMCSCELRNNKESKKCTMLLCYVSTY